MRTLLFLLALVVAASAQTPILADGQSNMCGRGTGGPAFSIAQNVEVWNNVNELGANGTAFVVPSVGSPPFDANDGNNLALWAAHRIAAATGDDVRMVIICRGGTSIDQWIDGSGNPGPMLLEAAAVYQASGLPPAEVMLRHQGETDKNEDPAWWDARTMASIQWLRDNDIIEEDAPVFLGGLYHTGAAAITNRMKVIAAREPLVYYVPHDGLPQAGDNVHFSGEGLARFGYRYAAAYLHSVGYSADPDINVFLAEIRLPPSTSGGDFTTGALRLRELNSLVQATTWADFDPIDHTVTLDAGVYRIEASAMAYRVDRHQLFLVDDDTGEIVADGSAEFAKSDASFQTQNASRISTILHLTTERTFVLKHWADTTRDNTGFGISAPSGPGRDAILGHLLIEQLD